MPRESIAWSATPPPQRLRCDIGVVALKPGEEVTMLLLGPVWWTTCHWVEELRKSVICRGEACEWHNRPPVPKGFCAVLAENRSWRGKTRGEHRCVCLLTPETSVCAAALRIGDVFTLCREMAGPKSLYSLTKTSRHIDPLPVEAFDPRPFVIRAMTVVSAGQWRKRA